MKATRIRPEYENGYVQMKVTLMGLEPMTLGMCPYIDTIVGIKHCYQHLYPLGQQAGEGEKETMVPAFFYILLVPYVESPLKFL